jgi:hypothetical protein
MTAEEVLENNRNAAIYNQNSDYRIKAMEEYAYLKCKELLAVVAEKAEIKVEKRSHYGKYRKWQKVKDDEEFNLLYYEMKTSIDKKSILNAVDLKEFI